MFSSRILLLFLLIFLGSTTFAGPAVAGTFYLHEHDAYWWYARTNPEFSTVVPNNAERYSEKRVAGQRIMEMTWDDGSVMIQVGSLPGSGRSAVIDSVKGQFLTLLRDVEVLDDREITTSNGVPALFYAVSGVDPSGVRSMVRTVVFERDGQRVFLLMTLDNARFQGDLREYWLRAVNGFQWD